MAANREVRRAQRLRPAALIPLLAIAAALLAPGSAAAVTETHTITSAPITVGGYEVQQSVMATPRPLMDAADQGYITRMEVDIVDENGAQVPIQRLMLHHIVFLNAGRADPTCDNIVGFDGEINFGSRERFFAAGEERAKLVLPDGYGYRFAENDPWVMTYMVMNHRAVTDTAYIQYKVTTVSGPQAEDDPADPADPYVERVDPYWFDVANCRADPVYNVPGTGEPGTTHTRSTDFTIPVNGRIVAGGGHVHGGARELNLTQPECGNREIAASQPTWGNPDHPFYNVKPILHEPGPINMTAFASPTGLPVSAGQTIRLNSLYDNSLPHTRVMGIYITYIDPVDEPVDGCGALPGDVQELGSAEPGRPGPIPYRIPLTGIDEKTGRAVKIKNPPGKLEDRKSGSELLVGDRFFLEPNVRVRKNARLRWRFASQELHNVTLANGPVGIGSDNLDGDRTFERKFTKKGTYRLFCALHPVEMTQRVVVTGRKRN